MSFNSSGISVKCKTILRHKNHQRKTGDSSEYNKKAKKIFSSLNKSGLETESAHLSLERIQLQDFLFCTSYVYGKHVTYKEPFTVTMGLFHSMELIKCRNKNAN